MLLRQVVIGDAAESAFKKMQNLLFRDVRFIGELCHLQSVARCVRASNECPRSMWWTLTGAELFFSGCRADVG